MIDKILTSNFMFLIFYPWFLVFRSNYKSYVFAIIINLLVTTVNIILNQPFYFGVAVIMLIWLFLFPYYLYKDNLKLKNQILFSKYKIEITSNDFLNVLRIINKTNISISSYLIKKDLKNKYDFILLSVNNTHYNGIESLSKCYYNKDIVNLNSYAELIKQFEIYEDLCEYDFEKLKLLFKNKQDLDEFKFLLTVERLKN